MRWLWRRASRDVAADRADAQRALEESRGRTETVERLARELENIRRHDDLAPVVTAAFRYRRPGGEEA